MAYTTIDDPTAYFQTKIYSGTGSDLSLTFDGSSDMQPDWMWIKRRSDSGNHFAWDSVRGVNGALVPNDTDAEDTSGESTNYFDSFDSDGFTVGGGGYANTNASGSTYVGWGWKAGGSASSNSSGDITSSVSANTTAGFSIVTYTGTGNVGATVGHGVGSALDMIIVKKRSASAQWVVGHKAMDSSFDNFLFLDNDGAKGNADNVFNDTAPTSSLFSIGNAGDTNASSQTYVAYCFAEKKGYSKFGSYTGNGNADGPFIYLGFRPAFCMFRNTTGDKWSIFDAKRSTFNVVDDNIRANLADAEVDQANKEVDFLSNGIKIRTSSGEWNGSGHQLIFMAFAENPLVTSTGIPGTAR